MRARASSTCIPAGNDYQHNDFHITLKKTEDGGRLVVYLDFVFTCDEVDLVLGDVDVPFPVADAYGTWTRGSEH